MFCMPVVDLFEASDSFAMDLLARTAAVEPTEQSPRFFTSAVAVSLAHEHWHAVRALLAGGLLPSAMVVHRSQFEATARSIWLLYAASENDVAKLNANLSLESEQTAKNMPSVAAMLGDLEKRGPKEAHSALMHFKTNSWKALTSYAHAGIHPLQRHSDGYPQKLLEDSLRNANGLAVIGFMQIAAIGGQPAMQREILGCADEHAVCMPPRL